jgi:MoaA/NifB/PqqE/SkfB family radical SAM enzyme
MKIGRGRPKKDVEMTKNRVFSMRITDKELDILDEMAEYLGVNKVEIVRRAIGIYHDLTFYN